MSGRADRVVEIRGWVEKAREAVRIHLPEMV